MSMGLGIPLLLFCGWLFAIFFYERPLVGRIGPKQLLYPGVLGIYILLWATSADSSPYASLIALAPAVSGLYRAFSDLCLAVKPH